MIADITLCEADYQWPEASTENETPNQELPDNEVSHLIANGTLTEEAWNAHLQGISWQIQVR